MARVIYHVRDDENGLEAFFTEYGAYLHGWHENDANWRNEYMNPLLNSLGFKVVCINRGDLVEEIRKKWHVPFT